MDKKMEKDMEMNKGKEKMMNAAREGAAGALHRVHSHEEMIKKDRGETKEEVE